MGPSAKFGMHRRLLICLLAVCISATWIPIVQAASVNSSRTTAKSSVGTPVDLINPTDYLRTDFTVENGLPNNVVNAIVQTQNGLLWVGTDSGLASFDGRDFGSINLQTEGAPHRGASIHYSKPGVGTFGLAPMRG